MHNDNDCQDSNSLPSVLVIDDEPFIHDLINETLADSCAIISVENGEDALMAIRVWKPELILVDVVMPGMGGYETCRQLRKLDDTAKIPVMFISAHDQLDDRLKGYEAGGDDFVAKPFDLSELRTKVLHLLDLSAQRQQLKSMADFATSTAMTAMASMSEMGVLLESLKRFNTCMIQSELATAALSALNSYGLQGAVQIRSVEEVLTQSVNGPASPLEISVLEHVTEMDRILQYHTRLSVTYEHFTLLVNNMPLDDADRCGRLRDHLAMLAEAADVRVQSILAMHESRRRRETMERMISRITSTLKDIDDKQRDSRNNTRLAVAELYDSLQKALLSVALSDSQDAFITSMIRSGIEQIVDTQSAEIDMQNQLSDIIREMKEEIGDRPPAQRQPSQ